MKIEDKKKSFIVDWVLPLAIALVIALLIKHFLVFQVRIPSGSMIPTLNIGDRLFVSKIYDLDKVNGFLFDYNLKTLNN